MVRPFAHGGRTVSLIKRHLSLDLQKRCYFRRAARITRGGVRMDPINHLKRNDWLVRNRIIDECQRIETGVDGLARTSLRFSSQGGP